MKPNNHAHGQVVSGVDSTAHQQVDETVHNALGAQELDPVAALGNTTMPAMITAMPSTSSNSSNIMAPAEAFPPVLALPPSGSASPTSEQIKEMQVRVKKADSCLKVGMRFVENIKPDQPEMVVEQAQKVKQQLLQLDSILYDFKKLRKQSSSSSSQHHEVMRATR